VRATDRAGNVTTPLVLTADSYPGPYLPEAGQAVWAAVSGFEPGVQVTVEFTPGGQGFAEFTADGSGVVSGVITIPDPVPADAEAIAFVAQADSEVPGPGPGPGPGGPGGPDGEGPAVIVPVELADTGVDLTPWLLAGGALLLAGAFLLLARLRRSRAGVASPPVS
jgi:LPXTG-motif cell wall-anchored protein